MGFPSKIQHTGSKAFKMGIYENTFWAHLTFETHSVIWAVTSWNSHCTMYSKYGLLMYTGSVMYFDRRVSAYVLSASGRFWRGHVIKKTQVKTSTKRVPVEPKCKTTAPAWSENINLTSRELISWTLSYNKIRGHASHGLGHLVILLFVCHAYSHQDSWFSRISSTVANRYRKSTSLLKRSVSITSPIKLVNIAFQSVPCIHAEWAILDDVFGASRWLIFF